MITMLDKMQFADEHWTEVNFPTDDSNEPYPANVQEQKSRVQLSSLNSLFYMHTVNGGDWWLIKYHTTAALEAFCRVIWLRSMHCHFNFVHYLSVAGLNLIANVKMVDSEA